MAKAKKDAAYLNVYIERTTLERLNKFCEEIGGNKSVTTDKAINMYIDNLLPVAKISGLPVQTVLETKSFLV